MRHLSIRFVVRLVLMVGLIGCLAPAMVWAESRIDLPEPVAGAPAKWLGIDELPLPFSSETEIVQFLREAPVVARKRLGEGINRPLKLTLEQDGVRMHAIFRSVDERVRYSASGSEHRTFRDSYRFEVAAYRLARLLGLDNVPPTVLRTLDGVEGSVQLWVEGATSEAGRRSKGLDRNRPGRWFLETQTMAAFDNLIYNFDRNLGNILYDRDGKVWMVDHTRSFKNIGMLASADEIIAVDRGFLERLRNLDPREVRKELEPYLDGLAIQAVLVRRKKLLRLIDSMVAERGVERVLFEGVSRRG